MLRPPPQLTVSEWAEQHRMLGSRASAEPGPWRTSRTPYLEDVTDVLCAAYPTRRVVRMKGAEWALLKVRALTAIDAPNEKKRTGDLVRSISRDVARHRAASLDGSRATNKKCLCRRGRSRRGL